MARVTHTPEWMQAPVKLTALRKYEAELQSNGRRILTNKDVKQDLAVRYGREELGLPTEDLPPVEVFLGHKARLSPEKLKGKQQQQSSGLARKGTRGAMQDDDAQPKKRARTHISTAPHTSAPKARPLIEEINDIAQKKFKPTIVVPSISSSASRINILNAKKFLEDGVYQEPDPRRMARPDGPVTFNKKVGGFNWEFRIVDSVTAFRKNDWKSCVAIVLDGKRWQLKHWPFKSEADLFHSVLGVSIRYEDDVADPQTVGGTWNVKTLKLKKNQRHTDAAVQAAFWRDIEAFLAQPKVRRFANGPRLEGQRWRQLNAASYLSANNHEKTFESYDSKFEGKSVHETLDHHDQTCTNEYYDIVTDFYEYGWGQSFHFAPRRKGESFEASLARLEHLIALKLGLKDGMKVADLGMGVGGPLRTVVGFSGATVTGVTINQYQVNRAKRHTRDLSKWMKDRCNYVQGDFTNIVPKVFEPESLDAVYYCESSVHTQDRVPTFTEAFKALKKGGKLLTYEWAMTDKYDPTNTEHAEIKRGIERGNGIANIILAADIVKQMESVGFKIIENYDMIEEAKIINGDNDVPWYHPLSSPWSLQGMQVSRIGRIFNLAFTKMLEVIGIAPKNAADTAKMLGDTAKALVAGGRTGIFTTT
ncbi:accessory factor associated with RNA polymerase II [Perkinsus chesapeaki]|uniref:Methyltransferase n=1 Tax=Perkinsus chesapeaki TaxID=330153 RepID=A0A7J6N1C5_PERCH|nr:accessory factor associated with RNA polymerase II [Perkinsus chesapeaki]